MGVMVGIGVAVGPDLGAGLSLQALRTTETVITVTNASRRILSFRLFTPLSCWACRRRNPGYGVFEHLSGFSTPSSVQLSLTA